MSADGDIASNAAEKLRALSARRFRLAITLTALVMIVYFGFIALVAFDPGLLALRVVPGLTLGILLGALVIVLACLSTLIYVYWANRHYDDALERLKG